MKGVSLLLNLVYFNMMLRHLTIFYCPFSAQIWDWLATIIGCTTDTTRIPQYTSQYKIALLGDLDPQ
jgi:hypothetical protein